MSASGLHLSVQYATAASTPRRDQIRRWVAATLREIDAPSASLAVRFVDEVEGRSLNRQFRGKDYATNVLTFPLDEPGADGSRVDADIVVCVPVVAKEARAQRKRAADHFAHLVMHGVLHAAGYDHESDADAAAMESIERAVLARFRIADPYL